MQTASARGRSRIATSSSSPLTELARTPSSRLRGSTSLRTISAAARAMLLDDALRAVELVAVRSTGRSSTSAPAAARPGSRSRSLYPSERSSLLEAERRKCDFLERWAPAERARRLGPRRGAADRLGRRRAREGARAAAGRCRVVPPARPARRRRSCSGSGATADLDALGRGFRTARRRGRRRTATASSSCGSSFRRRPGFHGATGMAKKQPLR